MVKSAKGSLFEYSVRIAHYSPAVVLTFDFGSTLLHRIGHSAEAMFISGEGASSVLFEAVQAGPDGTASFQFTAHTFFDLTGKSDPRIAAMLTCEGKSNHMPSVKATLNKIKH